MSLNPTSIGAQGNNIRSDPPTGPLVTALTQPLTIQLDSNGNPYVPIDLTAMSQWAVQAGTIQSVVIENPLTAEGSGSFYSDMAPGDVRLQAVDTQMSVYAESGTQTYSPIACKTPKFNLYTDNANLAAGSQILINIFFFNVYIEPCSIPAPPLGSWLNTMTQHPS